MTENIKFELGQRFFFVDYTDQIREGVVTKIIQEVEKDALYFFERDCFTLNDMYLDIDDIYSLLLASYEKEFNLKKNRLKEMRDKYLKEQEILRKEAI